jgi:hypothetical protein
VILAFRREIDDNSALLGNLLGNNPHEGSSKQNMQFMANLKLPKIGQGFFLFTPYRCPYVIMYFDLRQ